MSAEFNELVRSIFDDSSVVSITGPNGTTTDVLTTFNLVGESGNTDCSSIGALVSDGLLVDDYAGQTGWINRTINVRNLGSPTFMTFAVTDVEDTILSTIRVLTT